MRIPLLRTITRLTLSAGALVLVAGLSPAQGSVGEWDAKMEFNGQEITAKLIISKGPEGTLVGTWVSERGEGELSNVKFEDGVLSFVRTLSFGGGEGIELAFEGTIEGNQLNGMFITDFGEMAVGATRAVAARSPLVGLWDVTSDSQLGVLKRVLVIDADMKGTYESDEAKWPIRNVSFEEGKVSFGVTVDIQGQELPMEFAGQLDGTKIVGTHSVAELGPVADVTAERLTGPNSAVVLFTTEQGEFAVEVQTEAAPITSANFLRYVEEGFYDGGAIHRAVRLDNQTRSDILIEVIQARTARDPNRSGYPAIELERTNATGLKHLDGTISMARGGPDSATSGFFICIGAQPSLDFGGQRNADGQGFAAFGSVVLGMDVVRKIQKSPTASEGNTETLTPAIAITSARRLW
jgi:peptidyl-prolyl cis-trans isomerase A (cyclophilin A)